MGQLSQSMHRALLCAIVLTCSHATVFAMTPDAMNQTGYQREFKFLDADANGKLSAKEISKDALFGGGGFGKADTNHNQSLDVDEFSTYKSNVQQKQAKQAASDSAITTKIKSKYLVEKNFRSFRVSVETKEGVVVLSGFVENESTRKRAEQIAYEVSGVRAVKNALVVKP